MIVISDVTEFQLVETALQAYDERFTDFVGTAVDWFWETDELHHFTFISKNLKKEPACEYQIYSARLANNSLATLRHHQQSVSCKH